MKSESKVSLKGGSDVFQKMSKDSFKLWLMQSYSKAQELKQRTGNKNDNLSLKQKSQIQYSASDVLNLQWFLTLYQHTSFKCKSENMWFF